MPSSITNSPHVTNLKEHSNWYRLTS